jgi:iron-sulfur cluster repair protein YtfE (RIC family)
MRSARSLPTILAIVAITITTGSWLATGSAETSAKATAHAIPSSIQVEHEAIHSALVEATKAPGAVGAAAKELANVLHPHFVREEEIALPPLGLLEPLAAGKAVPEAEMADVLKMTDALKAELPRMLDEHKAIRAAVEKLGAAARAEKSASAQALADELAAHARTEEEVLYPAAILVGDVIRARQKVK